MKTRALLAWVLAVVACGAAPQETATHSGPVVATSSASFLDGAQRVYDVRWDVTAADGHAELVPGAISLSGGLALAGRLALAGVGREGDNAIVEVRWLEIDRAAIAMMEREIELDREELLEGRAWIVVPADGEVERVLFAPETSALFRQTMTGLVGHIDLRASLATTRASRVVPAGHGLADAEYVAAAPGHIVRRLGGYARFDAYASALPPTPSGETVIELDGAGLPIAIEGHERVTDESTLRHADDRFVMTSTDARFEPDALPKLATLVQHDPTAAPDDAEIRRQLALQAAEGLVPDDIALVVGGIDNGVLARPRTISRATGLLRGTPSLAEELVPIFRAARTGHGRAYVLDVLSSAGTPEAQAVMRDLLGDETVRGDADYDAFVQRFSFLRDPEPRTAEVLLHSYDDATSSGDDTLAAAIAYPLGAVSGRLRRDPVLAELLHSRLVDALATAATTELRDAAIAGLGNAARTGDLDLLASYLDDATPSTRMEAVAALRGLDDARARELVAGMLADPERVVASRALGVLERYVDADVAAPLLADVASRGAHHPALRDAIARAATDPS